MLTSKPSTTPAQYDPRRLTVFRGVTAYSDFHEFAHLHQHRHQTFAWQLRDAFFAVPVFNRCALLAVECEAALMARREMRQCGIWQAGDGQEAVEGLLSYVLALTIFSP